MKQDRLQFIQAFGGFLQQALPVGQASPQLVPVMMELMKFGTQAFKASRPIEGQIDVAMEQLKQAAAEPKGNPEAEAAQAQMQAEQQRMEMELQMKQQEAQVEAQLKQRELEMQAQMDKYKADLDAQTKINVARISANPGVDIPMLEVTKANTERMMETVESNVAASTQAIVQMQQQTTQLYMEMMTKLEAALRAMTAPKRIIRGPDGRAAGVELVQQNLPLQQPQMPMTRQ
jgi:hypothetical protein